MHRFFVEPATLKTTPSVRLGGDLAHQIARVLRLRPGEVIALIELPEATSGRDPDWLAASASLPATGRDAAAATGRDAAAATGRDVAVTGEWLVRLTRVSPALVEGDLEHQALVEREPRLHLTIIQALLKGDRMDYMLQKCTEVGVAAFVPIVTARTIARSFDDHKLARWQRIVREAAEQSGRTRLPSIAAPRSLTDIVSLLASPTAMPACWVLWEAEQALDLSTAWLRLNQSTPPQALALLVGPEGGLTPTEADHLAAGGATTVSLGPRLLRAETAGLVAASALLFASGGLGGAGPWANSPPDTQ